MLQHSTAPRPRRPRAPRALALLVGVILSLLVATPAGAFGDVDDDRFYADPVAWMVGSGITTGIEPGCFGPDMAVTRGQIGTFLYRLDEALGNDPKPSGHPFADVTADYQQEPVGWLYETGITTGVSATTFAPNAAISRGDFAVMLWRYAESPAGADDHPFTDVDRHYQDDAISWMAGAGITTGTSPTTFSPDGVITRAEAATFLFRYADPTDIGEGELTEACTRDLRSALQAAGLTGTEARCAAPFLTDFEIPYMLAVVQDQAEASWELIVAASEVANRCLAPERIVDLTRVFL